MLPFIQLLIIESLALDLESFAGHGKRSVINVEDVKVCPLRVGKLLTIK